MRWSEEPAKQEDRKDRRESSEYNRKQPSQLSQRRQQDRSVDPTGYGHAESPVARGLLHLLVVPGDGKREEERTDKHAGEVGQKRDLDDGDDPRPKTAELSEREDPGGWAQLRLRTQSVETSACKPGGEYSHAEHPKQRA